MVAYGLSDFLKVRAVESVLDIKVIRETTAVFKVISAEKVVHIFRELNSKNESITF